MSDDFFRRLQYLQEELMAEEEEDEAEDFDEDEEFEEFEEDELSPGYNYAVDSARAIYEDEEYDEPDCAEPAKKRTDTRGLRYLLLLEILGILAIIGWWLRWLI